MIDERVAIMAGVTIGARSFVTTGSVVTKDMPPRNCVKGCPGQIELLPANLDVEVDGTLTIQRDDLWHSEREWSRVDWSNDWNFPR